MKFNENELAHLFKLTRFKTNDFKNLAPEILLEDGRCLLIFRLALSKHFEQPLSQGKFGQLINEDWRTIGNIENGRTKVGSIETAQEYMANIARLFERYGPSVTLRDVINVYRRLNAVASGFDRIRARAANLKARIVGQLADPANLQAAGRLGGKRGGLVRAQRKQLDRLEKVVANAINSVLHRFKTHENIQAFTKTLNVDFAIPNGNSPQVVIEVSEIKSLRTTNVVRAVERLDRRLTNIKLNYPDVIGIIIVGAQRSTIEKLPPRAKEEILFADKVFAEQELPMFIKYLRSLEKIGPGPVNG